MRNTIAAALLVLPLALPQAAQAGMGVVTQKWHPEPCEGDACKADDPRSGLPCQGLLCTFSSAKAMQPPVTAAQAQAQQASRATEATPPVEAAPTKAVAPKKKRAKHATKADGTKPGKAKSDGIAGTEKTVGSASDTTSK